MPPRSTIEREGWFYLPTFLRDDKYDHSPGTCTLIVRHAELRRTYTGNLRVALETDALDFPDDDAMYAWIERHDAEALPTEAEGNPRYVPEDFRIDGATLVR